MQRRLARHHHLQSRRDIRWQNDRKAECPERYQSVGITWSRAEELHITPHTATCRKSQRGWKYDQRLPHRFGGRRAERS